MARHSIFKIKSHINQYPEQSLENNTIFDSFERRNIPWNVYVQYYEPTLDYIIKKLLFRSNAYIVNIATMYTIALLQHSQHPDD
jgi:hypothetical protein